MEIYTLKFTLKSDAAFGRGDGVTGLVDAEIQHDEFGCPYLSGRALKGILVNECADILACLSLERWLRWSTVAKQLFGQPGSQANDSAGITIGNAQLPDDIRQALKQDREKYVREMAATVEENGINPPKSYEDIRVIAENQFRTEVLQSLTTIRYQTAMDKDGVPKKHSLRSIRLMMRETTFFAALGSSNFNDDHLSLLAACTLAFRRAGTGRTRGRGKLKAELLDSNGNPVTDRFYKKFKEEALL